MEAISKNKNIDQKAVFSDLIRHQITVVNEKEDAVDQMLLSIKTQADREWHNMKRLTKLRMRFKLLFSHHHSYAEYVAANSVDLDRAKRLFKLSYDKLLDLNAQNSSITED